MGLDMYLTDSKGNELGYWRKANAIHGYIVRRHSGGVDECQKIELTRGDLKVLYARCFTVLLDISKAKDLLPPTEGFFFGSYEVDEDYKQDLIDTIKIINTALNSRKRTFIYQANW